MKSLSLLTCIIVPFFLLGQPGDSEQIRSEDLKLSITEKGTITYTVTSGGTGTVTHSFDRFSLLSATSTTIDYTLYGVATTMNEVDIRDGSFRFIYDLDRKSVRKKQAKTEIDLLRYKSLEDTRRAMFEINGGVLMGSETILGKDAEHWKFTSGPMKEAWYWDGIILKAEVKRPRITYSYEATAIDLAKAEVNYPDIDQ